MPEPVAVALARTLRDEGLAVPLDATITFARALGHVAHRGREGAYWAGRATLLRRPEDQPAFDRAFARVVDGMPLADRDDPEPVTIDVALAAPDAAEGPDDPGVPDDAPPDDGHDPATPWSPAEVLRHKDLAACTPDERDEVHRLIADLRLRAATRPGRRRRPDRHPRPGHTPDLRRTTRAAFEPRSRMGREEFWHERWNNRRWQLALRLFFSERVIAKLGRDESFFEHVQVDVGKHYAQRAYHAFVEVDPSTNPFLQYIVFGHYLDLEHGHPYLAPQHFETLRDRLDRLEVVCAEMEGYLGTCEPGAFTGYNLSDIFEWMSGDLHERVYRAIVRTAAPGATLAYWNNLVPRSAPASLLESGAATTDRELAARLHDADRSFLYRDFHVDTVVDPEAAR